MTRTSFAWWPKAAEEFAGALNSNMGDELQGLVEDALRRLCGRGRRGVPPRQGVSRGDINVLVISQEVDEYCLLFARLDRGARTLYLGLHFVCCRGGVALDAAYDLAVYRLRESGLSGAF